MPATRLIVLPDHNSGLSCPFPNGSNIEWVSSSETEEIENRKSTNYTVIDTDGDGLDELHRRAVEHKRTSQHKKPVSTSKIKITL